MPNYGLGDNLVLGKFAEFCFFCFFFVLPILVNVPVNASHATEMDDQACGKTQRRISAYDHKLNILPSACSGHDGTSA